MKRLGKGLKELWKTPLRGGDTHICHPEMIFSAKGVGLSWFQAPPPSAKFVKKISPHGLTVKVSNQGLEAADN